MVYYMHVMLFFICLNFGLGIAHIPDTPLSIPDSGLTSTSECINSFTMQGLLVRNVDGNGIVTYTPSTTNNDGTPIYGTTTDGTPISDLSALAGNFTGGLNPITEAAESLYTAGETVKNVLLGGYVTNVLDSLTLSCDTDQYTDAEQTQLNPNYGQSKDSEVMTYFKAGIHVIFGLMIFLTLFYIITGKNFGF